MAARESRSKRGKTDRSAAVRAAKHGSTGSKNSKRVASKPAPIAAPRLADDAPRKDRSTKQAQLIHALRVPPGATISELITLTGWQAHTIRGTVSGVLRKRLGLSVSCDTRNPAGERLYRIADVVA